MNIRRFNTPGLERFSAFLDELRRQPTLAVPREMLEDAGLSEGLEVDILIEPREFPRRFEAAEYLHSLLHGRNLREPERDAGLWAWLSLYFFDQVCPQGAGGGRKVRTNDSYVPLVENRLRFYRHLLLGPYLIRGLFDDPQVTAFLLTPPLHIATDEVYRLFVEGPLIQSDAAVYTAASLYWDAEKSIRKRGTGVKDAGGMRRFVSVLQQFDRTIDLQSTFRDRVLGMLPREFDKFRKEVKHDTRASLDRTGASTRA